MPLLRFASFLVLAFWIGGLATLGSVAAPAIFSVIQAHDPIAGRVLAGAVFGEIFRRFEQITCVLGAVLLVLLGFRAALGPRPRWLKWRVLAVACMLAMSLITALALAPRIEAIRRDVAGPIASLTDTDPRKIAFGRLHGASDILMILTLVAGLGLFWCEARDS